MALRSNLFWAALGLALAAPAAVAHPPDRDQDTAFKATRQGRFLSLRMIEAKIVPQMRGADYLGSELDAGASRYRLKFIRNGHVIWVDVDARTGEMLGKSGG